MCFRSNRTALILALLMIIPTISLVINPSNNEFIFDTESLESSNSETYSPPILVEGLPPLYCDEITICPTPSRNPIIPEGAISIEEPGWWHRYSPDKDSNGFDDRLQYVLSGAYPSESPTAIIGSDGKLTVAINVDYAWNPRAVDIAQLTEVLENHGWVGEEGGAEIFPHHWVDSIAIDKVPQSSLLDIYHLPGVVVIEQQNVLAPTLDVATPSIKARSSSVYATSAQMLGYRGDGIIIAIIDSGVDNEHRSLNDFDDINDDPDADATSYSDAKYLGGYDSTSGTNNTDGTDDPDDTAGHGTHVAGIALGTGGPTRQHMGVAPGAYLIDVKAFQDIGRANSQDTQDSISWVIDNKNTLWKSNGTELRGIHIMSMSFGRVMSPVPGTPDTGDDGTGVEARLVNKAFDEGIVPVCAMGNDGSNYVSSPASADRCIAVAALDDHNTILRDDDSVAGYSNYGPRQDDGDSDSLDELKPDVIAPGSGIKSAEAQFSSIGGVGGSVLADDSYTSKDGTSMATPMVSGLCALILQANPNFSPADVRDALHFNSEFNNSLDVEDSFNGNEWNATEGFGRIDAPLSLKGGGGRWVTLDLPLNNTWLDVGENYRLRGSAELLPSDIKEVNGTISELSHIAVTARYTYDELVCNGNNCVWKSRNKTAFVWDNATGTDNWTYDFSPELWHDGAGLYIEVRAWDNFNRVSVPAWAKYHIGESWLTLVEPSGYAPLSGDVLLRGDYKAVNGSHIEYKIDSEGEWVTGYTNLVQPYTCVNPNHDSCNAETWSATWDSTEVQDGGWIIYTRIAYNNGYFSQPVERYVLVDNIPPSADLEPIGDLIIDENGIDVDDAYVNSFLNVKTTIRNNGDAHARNFDVVLLEDGSQVASYSVSKLDSTKSMEITFGYHPTVASLHELEVVIDLANDESESNEGNNEISRSFLVNNRPSGVDLAIRDGAARMNPPIANPNGEILLNIRVENLAADSSSGSIFSLEKWNDLGWEMLESERSLNVIPGSSYLDVPFTISSGDLGDGLVKMRASVSLDNGLDINNENNQLDFDVLVDKSQLQGARSLDLPSGHEVIGFFGASGENLLFTGEDKSIWVHRINSQYDIITCLELEDDWEGEFSYHVGESDSVFVTWTRRYTDEFGVTLSTLSFTDVDLSCTNSEVIDLMPPLMLAEGNYWGLDISVKDGESLIAGYHRDIFTNGTYDDVTSIFLLSAEAPLDPESWVITEEVIPNLPPPLGEIGSVHVSQGNEYVHLLYQVTRDDETGIERVGTFYAHGKDGVNNWSFRKILGDETSLTEFETLVDSDGKDIVVMAWREGSGFDSQIVVTRSDSKMVDLEISNISAPGLSKIEFVNTERGIQLFHDSVGPLGRQLVYSLITEDQVVIGTPIAEGELALADRSYNSGETHIFYYSLSGDWRARMLIDDSSPDNVDNSIFDTIRIWSGLDERTFDLAWKIVTVACAVGCLLIFLASAGIATHRRRKGPKLTVEIDDEVDDEDEVLDIEEENISLIEEVETLPLESSDELEPKQEELPLMEENEATEEESVSKRRRRRKARQSAVETVVVEELPEPPSSREMEEDLPPPPTPMELGALPPPPGRDVTCDCGANFRVKSLELKHVKCPVCNEKIVF